MNSKYRVVSFVLAIFMMFSMSACNSATPANNSSNSKFPEKPLEIIVGFAAGGGNHLAAENLTPGAQGAFGQPMAVTCKPGAATAIANSYIVASPADGYTLLNATLSLPISLYTGAVDYKMEDFVGVAMYSDVAPCLVINSNLPINSLDELVEYVKANPGKFTWGHSGVAAVPHLAGSMMFKEMGIIDLVKEVPFTGTNEAVAQVLGGHIDAVISFSVSVSEQVKAGNMRVIGISSPERIDDFPDAPTCIEQGYDVTLTSSRGIFVRSDTPQEIIDKLEAGFKTIVESEEFQERAVALGEPPVFMNSKDFTKLYHEQCDIVKVLVEELGLAGQ